MDWTHLPRPLALGALLALPASAQEPPKVVLPPLPPSGVVAFPEGTAPCPPQSRPGLFGWRARHAERKRQCQEKFIGYPEEFNEWPLGSSLYANGRAEVANGQVARLVFNHCDFVDDTAELNFRGQDKLAAVSALLPTTFAPVIVERTPWAPKVAEGRRLMIFEKLAQGPFPVPVERVVVAAPIARGFTGTEAILVNANRLELFYHGGGNIGGDGTDSGGLTGGAGANRGAGGGGGSGVFSGIGR